MAVVLRRKMAGPNSPALWPVVVRMLPAVLVAIAAGHSLDDFLADWPALLRGAITGCVALGLTLTVARLWLAEGARIGLAVALDLLGVGAPTEMWRDEQRVGERV